MRKSSKPSQSGIGFAMGDWHNQDKRVDESLEKRESMGHLPLRKTNLRKETIDIKSLGEEERETLGQVLFHQLQQKVFSGVDYDSFLKEVFPPKADEATISLYFTNKNDLVGYLQYSHTCCELLGRPSVLVRSVTGLLPAYRNQSLIGGASAKYLLHLYLRYPLRSIYVFTSPISPISYKTIGKTLSEYWPNPRIETPTHIQQLFKEICAFYTYTSNESNPMIRQVGWKVNDITKQSFNPQDTLIQFYIDSNPHYADGYGLMTVTPIHTKNIVSGLRRLMSKRWKMLWKRQPTKATPH